MIHIYLEVIHIKSNRLLKIYYWRYIIFAMKAIASKQSYYFMIPWSWKRRNGGAEKFRKIRLNILEYIQKIKMLIFISVLEI